MQSRKKFLKKLGAGMLVAGLPALAHANPDTAMQIDAKDFQGEGAPDDEKYWKRIARKYYNVSPAYINLENGYYGIQPKPVLQASVNSSLSAASRHSCSMMMLLPFHVPANCRHHRTSSFVSSVTGWAVVSVWR